MYMNVFVDRRNSVVHLWDSDRGHISIPMEAVRYAYRKKDGGEFKSLYGDELEKTPYYEDGDPNLLESDVPIEVKTLIQAYSDSDDPSEGHRIGIIDIEVDSTGGFPDIEKGDKTITCIALYDTPSETFFSFVLDPDKKITSQRLKTKLHDTDDKSYDWVIRSFRAEKDLLKAFLTKWEECNFSIISGWHTNGFDLPFLFARIREVLGKRSSYKLSPIEIAYFNPFTKTMKIAGISCLDYLELYKKFIGKDQPSFSLGYIGQDEVGMGKTQFRGSLVTLYQQDLKKYVEYNLTDVKIVAALEKKLDFIYLARSVCHKGHVPYEWYMYSSRWIDGALLTYLHRNGLVAPNRPIGGKEVYETMKEQGAEGFEGAYVKDPVPGLYDWVYSADVTSLYPSTIISLNISPEKKIGKVENWSSEKFANGEFPDPIVINGKQYTREEFKALVEDQHVAIAANGVMFKTDSPGIVPIILSKWFAERVEYKKLAEEFKVKGDKEKEVFYDRRQKRQKIFMNSVYGTLGLPIFRFYDKDNAEATTVSGQHIIKMTQRYVNMVYAERFAAKGKTVFEDFVIYIDTDSVYMSAKPLMELDGQPIDDDASSKYVIDLSHEISRGINEFYGFAIPTMFNLSTHRIKISEDVIARTGLWVKKKRYALLKVYDMEKRRAVVDKNGILGKLEVKGIDVVRTSFPARFRKFSGELLNMILRRVDQKIIDDRILQMETEIKTLPVEEIAKNTSVTFVSKKGDANYNPPKRKLFSVPTLKTPPQVGAALMYNDFLKKFDLLNQYEPIHSGQKIKWIYLRENPYALDYLAMKADGTDPDEILEIVNTYADRKAMYEKELKTKLVRFYTVLKWQYPSITSKIASSFFKPRQTVVIEDSEDDEDDEV